MKLTFRTIAALVALCIACVAQAKNYDPTPVFAQDFENGATYTDEITTGAVASERLGSSHVAPAALPDGYAVSTVSYTLSDKDDAKISPETRTKYDTKAASQYLRVVRYGNTTANILYNLPAAVKNLKDYKLEFDYHLGTSYQNALSNNGASYAGTNGLAVCLSSGAILATIASPAVGTKNLNVGQVFKGDTTEQIGGTFTVSGRGEYDSDKGYWLHVVIRGNAEEGVVMSVANEAGTVILAETQLSATFDVVDKLYMKAAAYQYRHCISLDDVAVYKPIGARTFTWTGSAGDNAWATPGNWTVNGVTQTDLAPDSIDTAIIGGNGLVIATPVGQAVSNLNLAAGCKLTFDVGNMVKNDAFSLFRATECSGSSLSDDNLLVLNVPENYALCLDVKDNAATAGLYNVFYWTGKGGNTRFANAANWACISADGPTPSIAPAGGATVSFPASFTGGVTVTFDASTDTAGIYFVLDCDVTFASDGDTMRTIYPWSIKGEGSLSLANHITVQTVTGKDMPVDVDVNVLPSEGSDPWASYARFYLRGEKTDVTFNGALRGTGCLYLDGDGNQQKYYFFNGDTASFGGKLHTVYSFANKSQDECNTVRLAAAAALDFSHATLDVAGRIWVLATNDGNTLSVGALTGTGKIVNRMSNDMTLEVGALGNDASADVQLTRIDDAGSWTVKKVGAGCQTFTVGTMTNSVILTAGTLGVPAGIRFDAVTLQGGKFKFAIPNESPWTDATACTLFTCKSGVEAGRKVDYVSLDLSALQRVCVPTYDNSQANTLMVTLAAAAATWNGPQDGLWSDAANWLVEGEQALSAPGEGDAVTIGANAVIAVNADCKFGKVTADSSVQFKILFTDSQLSFTAPDNFPGVIATSGPFTMTRSGNVYSATRVPSVFTWVGADGDWSDTANWRVNDTVTGVPPSADDEVRFPAGLGAVAVTLASESHAALVRADAELTLKGPKVLRSNLYCGAGELVLDGGRLYPQTTADTVISNDIRVVAGSVGEIRLASAKCGHVYGNVTGAGRLTWSSSSSDAPSAWAGLHFHGDNTAFAGTFEQTEGYGGRSGLGGDSWKASSSNAVWIVASQAKDTTASPFIQNNTDTYYFGALTGVIQGGYFNAKFEIGHRDDADSEFTFKGRRNSSGVHTACYVTKVGGSKLTLKTVTCGGTAPSDPEKHIGGLTLKGGATWAQYVPLEYLTFAGLGATLQMDVDASGTPRDPSAVIKNSTSAITFDDQGLDATWGTALAASNVGGFTKKGTGTLTLLKIPLYKGATTVEAGELVVPSGTKVTLGAGSDGTITGAIVAGLAHASGTPLAKAVTQADDATSVAAYDLAIDCSNVRVDFSARTDWDRNATYYLLTDGGKLYLGTSLSGLKPSEQLVLPASEKGRWTLRAAPVAVGGKTYYALAVVARKGRGVIIW